jgi:hypothetical protein
MCIQRTEDLDHFGGGAACQSVLAWAAALPSDFAGCNMSVTLGVWTPGSRGRPSCKTQQRIGSNFLINALVFDSPWCAS